MKCPVCEATMWLLNMNTNHSPIHDWRGHLIGYAHGVPEATFHCGNQCEITVRGTERYEALCKR